MRTTHLLPEVVLTQTEASCDQECARVSRRLSSKPWATCTSLILSYFACESQEEVEDSALGRGQLHPSGAHGDVSLV